MDKLETLYAWVGVEDDGREAILISKGPDSETALISSSYEKMRKMAPAVRKAGAPNEVRLIKLTREKVVYMGKD